MLGRRMALRRLVGFFHSANNVLLNEALTESQTTRNCRCISNRFLCTMNPAPVRIKLRSVRRTRAVLSTEAGSPDSDTDSQVMTQTSPALYVFSIPSPDRIITNECSKRNTKDSTRHQPQIISLNTSYPDRCFVFQPGNLAESADWNIQDFISVKFSGWGHSFGRQSGPLSTSVVLSRLTISGLPCTESRRIGQPRLRCGGARPSRLLGLGVPGWPLPDRQPQR